MTSQCPCYAVGKQATAFPLLRKAGHNQMLGWLQKQAGALGLSALERVCAAPFRGTSLDVGQAKGERDHQVESFHPSESMNLIHFYSLRFLVSLTSFSLD